MVERTDPPYVAAEAEMLAAWLEFHRATLARKCDGLGPDELRRRSAEPSSLTLLGLVRHMAEVERHWFRRVLAGEDVADLYCTPEDRDADFNGVPGADADEAFSTWQAECDAARAIAAGLDLDTVVSHAHRGDISVRWVLTHMVEEYARHNGHADLLRERIDGATGD